MSYINLDKGDTQTMKVSICYAIADWCDDASYRLELKELYELLENTSNNSFSKKQLRMLRTCLCGLMGEYGDTEDEHRLLRELNKSLAVQ